MIESTAYPRPHPTVGSQLVRVWEPTTEPIAEMVLVHGLAEHSGRYERPGGLFAQAGIRVVAPDLVGFGATGGKRGDVDDWAVYLDQVQDLVEEARGTGRPVVLFGHSMGGLIAFDYALSERPKPDLLVLSAPALEGGARWQRKLAPVLARIAPGLSVPNKLKGEQLSRDPAVGQAYFSDPLVHTASTSRLGAEFFAAMDRVRGTVGRLDLPTLVTHGGADAIVPPTCTVELGSLPGVERRLYPKLRHETLNEPEGPEVAGEIIDWIKAHLG
jgi:alpha-beta hydrolase superfamily lysophospholipase